MDNRKENSYFLLLNDLKLSVENLSTCNLTNSWEVSDGFHRLHVAVANIFKHGFKFRKENGEPDVWVFIQGLSWLQPSLAASPSFISLTPHKSPMRNSDKAMTWLYKSIENYNLSEKLLWLLSDHQHLQSCYSSTAFLRQLKYGEASLICLRALEQHRFELLSEIDPNLYTRKKSTHQRSFSEPKIGEGRMPAVVSATNIKFEILKDTKCVQGKLYEKFVTSVYNSSGREQKAKIFIKRHLLKKSSSHSDLYLMYYKEKYKMSFLKDFAMETTKRRKSFSQCSFSEDHSNMNSSSQYSELLKIRYDNPECRNTIKTINDAFVMQVNDNDSVDSSSDRGSNSCNVACSKTKETSPDFKPKRHRRRSSFFKLPFRIWEESSYDEDENPSVSSEDSKTFISDATLSSKNKRSFIENGGNITLPMSLGGFTKPSPGQSILSFLSSGVFTYTNAELDRENAHFHISEAMIAALEQAKFNQQLKAVDEILEESDEEINQLKHIIRIRRRQKQIEKHYSNAVASFSTDTTTDITTDQSANSLSSSIYSTSESITTDNEDEEYSRKRRSWTKGISVADLTPYANNTDTEERPARSVSAESVAISLLKRFKENQLPAASEIQWLVSERDAPQQILPLPESVLVSNDIGEHDLEGTSVRLRGTFDWAPPRPQIIFTPHPSPSRKQIMEKQKYRCAGCGSMVAKKYASKFRYCEYLGRYFCTACHSGLSSVIPGRILSKWDFGKYPVSNFSLRLLEQMFGDLLFNIMDLNPSLYHRARDLQKIRMLRVALSYIKDLIFLCKYSERAQAALKWAVPPYIYNKPHNYSLADLIHVKNGKLFKTLSDLFKVCENHVNHCELCQARGFICEICKKQQVIFPWQLNCVVRCAKCGSCHHIKCYKCKPICPKCARINNRTDLNKIS